MGVEMVLCWYWILLERCLDFFSAVACFLSSSFQKEAGRQACSTLQRNSFILRQFCSWQFGCQLGIGDLAERVCRREGGTMFPGFCCGLSDCYQCNWATDCRETGLNNPGGAEMGLWEEGRGLQVIIPGCALFCWLSGCQPL